MTAHPLGIVELVEVCAQMRARNVDAFERLGAWATARGGPGAGVRRLLATAAHRHAWHADLWAARTPTIPIAADQSPSDLALDGLDPVGAYRTWLEAMALDLDRLASRVDGQLDPGTARTISLVRADLAELAGLLE